MMEALGASADNLGDGFARDQLRAPVGGDRDCDFHRFGFQPHLDAGERAIEPRKTVADQRERNGSALIGLGLRLRLPGGKAPAMRRRLRVKRRLRPRSP